MGQQRRRRPQKPFFRREKLILGIIIAIFSFFFSSIVYAFITLPRTDNLENLQMMAATQVYDINGQLISKLFEENRTIVSFNNMSPI